MKFKFGYSYFDRDSGVSMVTIYTPVGKFTGKAHCHSLDVKSEFTGCRYAEYRARIKAMKELRKLTRERLVAVENLYKEMESCKGFNPKSIEARHTRRFKYELIHKCDRLNETITAMENGLKQTIAAHDEAIATLQQEKSDNND